MPRASKAGAATIEKTAGSKTRGASSHLAPEESHEEIVALNPSDVEVGDIMAIVTWVRVEDKLSAGKILGVRDLYDEKKTFTVSGGEIVKGCFSADRYGTTEYVSKTRAAEILIASHNRPLTVEFVKKEGEKRKLRGKLLKHEVVMGRSWCEDFDAKKDDGTPDPNRLRQVDHRTIESLIVNGFKYEVKTKGK